MTSRFFRGDSDSEDEDSSGSEVEETTKAVPTRFARGEDSDGDEPEQKRVVKSNKEKTLDQLQDVVTAVQGYIKANQWSKIQTDFDKLNKAVAKVQAITKEVPTSYIKTLAMLDDACVKAMEEKDKKKLVKADAQALAIMKSTLKKNNAAYESKIAEYRQNAKEESEEEEEEESDDDDEPAPAPAKPAAKPAAAAAPKNKFFVRTDDSDSEEDSDFPDDSDESSSSSDEDGATQGKGKWFLKKPAAKETPTEPIKKPPKKEGDKKRPPKEDAAAATATAKETTKEVTPEQLDKKIQELVELRGRKGTERKGQVEQLEALTQHAKTDDKMATILAHVVDAQFDVTAVTSVATHMPVSVWKSALANLNKILQILEKNPTLILAENEEDRASGAEEGTVATGNLLAFVERLDDEFIKSLQNIDDPHTHEYVQRLQDEQGFVDLAERVQSYYERVNNKRRAARVAARRLEHLYYKHEKDVRALAKAAAAKEVKPVEGAAATAETPAPTPTPTATPTPTPTPTPQEPEVSTPLRDLIHRLAYLVYANGDERLRARTMLMHIYHHALHDRFYEARDMMLMSHLQETIHLMDIPTQILFNRTMVQLGLCAFRGNLIAEAHSCLADICGGGRVKELLAQGVTNTQRFGERNAEQEKIERKRLVPFHMHLNLELLECVHLISAMLLEVPNMAQNPFDLKKKIISRAFRRLLDYFDRQVFTGPPENNRDYVAAASKALSAGDWKTCEGLLLSLKVWVLMPHTENVKAAIRKRIQEEGLRTYLFTYSNFYDSMSLSELSAMFELAPNAVHSIVSKMIINEELYASWDQPTSSIIMQRAEPTKLQYLAMQFAEKAAVFVENNERLLDSRTGGYGYNKQEGGKPQGKERGQWQEGGGGYYNRQQHQYQGGRGGGRQYNQRQDGYNRHQGSYQGGGGRGGKHYDRGDRSDRGGYGGGGHHYRNN